MITIIIIIIINNVIIIITIYNIYILCRIELQRQRRTGVDKSFLIKRVLYLYARTYIVTLLTICKKKLNLKKENVYK